MTDPKISLAENVPKIKLAVALDGNGMLRVVASTADISVIFINHHDISVTEWFEPSIDVSEFSNAVHDGLAEAIQRGLVSVEHVNSLIH